jgi:hypothetical protein
VRRRPTPSCSGNIVWIIAHCSSVKSVIYPISYQIF